MSRFPPWPRARAGSYNRHQILDHVTIVYKNRFFAAISQGYPIFYSYQSRSANPLRWRIWSYSKPPHAPMISPPGSNTIARQIGSNWRPLRTEPRTMAWECRSCVSLFDNGSTITRSGGPKMQYLLLIHH